MLQKEIKTFVESCINSHLLASFYRTNIVKRTEACIASNLPTNAVDYRRRGASDPPLALNLKQT